MRKPAFLLLSALIFVAVLAPFAATVTAGQDQVQLCRVTGNGDYVVIEVAAPTVDAYLAHGDLIVGVDVDGNCEPLNSDVILIPGEFPFWIDKYEVTNAKFAECVAAGACNPPNNFSSATRPSYYDNPAYADYPVIFVFHSHAYDYCEWIGGYLPDTEQWSKAAGADDGRLYPWGDGDPNCSLANSYNDATSTYCVGDTTRVGSYPDGASPYGALDMAGNVWEWTGFVGPEGAVRLHSGGYRSPWYALRVATFSSGYLTYSEDYLGFRCAYHSIEIPTADVNCDGSLNVIDALFVLQYSVELREGATVCPPDDAFLFLPACDTNGDGFCDVIDALFILQCDVEINNVLCPAEP